jgi:hypothetical protein
MKAEFRNDGLLVVPETADELAHFQKLFPEQFMRNSRYLNVRQFVDPFGNPEPNRPYLLINGYDPSTEATAVRPRKKKLIVENESQTAANQ